MVTELAKRWDVKIAQRFNMGITNCPAVVSVVLTSVPTERRSKTDNRTYSNNVANEMATTWRSKVETVSVAGDEAASKSNAYGSNIWCNLLA